MNNNQVLKKVSIASNLRHEGILEIFKSAGYQISLSQVKSWMAGPKHKSFCKLKDNELEDFLNALIDYSRGDKNKPQELPQIYKHIIIGFIDRKQTAILEELIELASDALTICLEDEE